MRLNFILANYFFTFIIIVCICFAGICSGLTVGLLSIDQLDLEIKKINGNKTEKNLAISILPILHNHHWLLVTLLVCNALAMECLPIFLDRIVPSAYAVLISVVAIVFFGEVIPQAVCIGPNQLKIAKCSMPLVRVLMILTAPVSWPVAKLLDVILGEHKIQRFNNSELEAIIKMHEAEAIQQINDHINADDGKVGLEFVQTQLIRGALNWQKDTADKVKKPIDNVYMISVE